MATKRPRCGAGHATCSRRRSSRVRSCATGDMVTSQTGNQQILHPGIERLSAVDRSARPILERLPIATVAVPEGAREPLVAHRPANAERRAGFRVFAYSIQGDHLHLVVEADDARALARGMKAVGTRVARAVNRTLCRTGPVLRDRYHLRVLRTPLEVRRALAYCLLNARKHLGRLAPRVGRVDPASSGRRFTGWRPGISAVARSAAPVARAVTWLLREGWRRHGLLDPSEVPGLRPGRASK